MENKKLVALLVAICTISTTMFGLLGDIVEGTFDTAGRVATAPVDAVTDDGRTWSEKRDDRRLDRQARRDERMERAQERREERRDRYYYND